MTIRRFTNKFIVSQRVIGILALTAAWSGGALAQDVRAGNEPPANPLPVIVYPTRVTEPAAADRAPAPAQSPSPLAEAPPPADQVQYELVGGVWGFWDRDRHFHPRPPSIDRGAAGARPGAFATHTGEATRRNEFPPSEIQHPSVSRGPSGLSNVPPRAIVVQSPTPRERSLAR